MVSVIGKEEGTLARPLLAERKLDSSGVASPISASAPISVPSATGKQRPLLRPPPSFLWPADSSGVASAHQQNPTELWSEVASTRCRISRVGWDQQPGQWLEGKNQAIHCIGPALIVKPGQLFGAFMPRQVQGLFHCLVGSCTLVCPWNAGMLDASKGTLGRAATAKWIKKLT
ncbi:uncharacterized protein LOC120678792 isoform X2 [Panicum virgatum]|uniref:Uncharacterized protein n=1 Tax=Panicum virgatum TaxID=38727 RepID=A0A8T0QZS6_PANVG|nr:uncharacterized protein LOC120678792 isoform X2 [Panicum virgatum]XP_039816095.1 uncharacterized protein LOC120678792 isoform X2 [Panicum virgatum]XP_039816096.1 uncharacterized protein LOC120678792 isoform X2 [Panicum virgatum]KAG2578576.1 hypothetical protein PVAP13_6NG119603 [Panicum virgatum]